jgi:hypothetical protein
MGRPARDPGPKFRGTVELRIVNLHDGYDRLGAYFGCREYDHHLFWVGAWRPPGWHIAPLDVVLEIHCPPGGSSWQAAVTAVRERWPLATIRIPACVPSQARQEIEDLLLPDPRLTVHDAGHPRVQGPCIS